ncbi:hypothetical protein D3C78_1120940 [compost metagenome]
MVAPASACCRISAKRSAFAPRSMPLVGSSSSSSFGAVASQREMKIFCWLPPDSVPIGISKPANFVFMSSATFCTRGFSVAGRISRIFSRTMRAATRFSKIDRP